jgi:hypothetical protein
VWIGRPIIKHLIPREGYCFAPILEAVRGADTEIGYRSQYSKNDIWNMAYVRRLRRDMAF